MSFKEDIDIYCVDQGMFLDILRIQDLPIIFPSFIIYYRVNER